MRMNRHPAGPEEDVKEVVAAIAKRLRSCSNKDTALKALKVAFPS
jgi:hypothetical protein